MHDQNVCNTNCRKNGKLFNQKPHHCPYFTGASSFNNLLEKRLIDDADSSEVTTKSSPKIAEFFLQRIQLDDFIDEVDLGVRNQDDLLAQQKKTEKM